MLEKSLPLPGIELKFPDSQAGGLDNFLIELNVSCCKPDKFKYLYNYKSEGYCNSNRINKVKILSYFKVKFSSLILLCWQS